MISLMEEIEAKALKLNIPLSVQIDLTYRCNERCVHCYLDHEDHGEMTTAGDHEPCSTSWRKWGSSFSR
jgi:MoaA/NifB/PqqE/SkfB family radical SAM enzyme